jgi:SAM-dependent methyltransferase
VGIDFSEAIFIAAELLKDKENVVLAQGDIYHLPLKREFDFIYSWGVLHHTPSVKKGFEALVPFVREGGEISFGAYRNWHPLGTRIQSLIRSFTCRMPISLLYYLSYMSLPLNSFYQSVGKHIPGVREAVRFFIKPSHDWRICHTDTFDWWHPYYNHYHTLEELVDWVESLGLKVLATDVLYNSVRALKTP